jgi:hypothetical protein
MAEDDMDARLLFRDYRAQVTSALPRFTGPAQVRQRIRLAAALGLLAIAALLTGGLASLAASRSDAAAHDPGERVAEPASSHAPLPDLIDPATLVEARVEQAEHAVSRARAAIRSARQLGVVDQSRLDELERELDKAIGRPPASAAPAPAGSSSGSTSGSGSGLASRSLDPSPRAL